MSGLSTRIFPTVDLLSTAEITKATRGSLFGPKMRVFPGGWSFNDRGLLEKLAIVPPVVASGDIAAEYGLRYMRDANRRWVKAGQDSLLLPTDASFFRLVRAETRMISRGRRPLAWRITWLVFADLGTGGERTAEMPDGFAPVSNAVISLTVSLTGRIVGGSATWRPTRRPFPAAQEVTPKTLFDKITAAHAATGDNEGHPHGGGLAQAPPPAGLEIRYAAGERAEFCNFLDPRLHYIDPGNHHAPGLVVPMTTYGLSAQILTFAERAGSGGAGRVIAVPWVTGCHGSVPLDPLPAGHRAHWTVLDFADGPEAKPRAFSGGEPLKISGLKQLAFTVTNDTGCIAHAHAEVCSQLDAKIVGRRLLA
jgi:hypothetical protein